MSTSLTTIDILKGIVAIVTVAILVDRINTGINLLRSFTTYHHPSQWPKMKDISQESAGLLIASRDGYVLLYITNPHFVNKEKGETLDKYKEKKLCLETPGGKMEAVDEGDPVKCAMREFDEEVGCGRPYGLLEVLDIPFTTDVLTMLNPGRGTPEEKGGDTTMYYHDTITKQTLVVFTVEKIADLIDIKLRTDHRMDNGNPVIEDYVTVPRYRDKVMVHGHIVRMCEFWDIVHGTSVGISGMSVPMRKWTKVLITGCLNAFIPKNLDYFSKSPSEDLEPTWNM